MKMTFHHPAYASNYLIFEYGAASMEGHKDCRVKWWVAHVNARISNTAYYREVSERMKKSAWQLPSGKDMFKWATKTD
jgi:hypothetical protein